MLIVADDTHCTERELAAGELAYADCKGVCCAGGVTPDGDGGSYDCARAIYIRPRAAAVTPVATPTCSLPGG